MAQGCGGLIVDKPSGPTSHDIVALVRRALGESRIGHTGTLDPLATGVLVLLVGRATRLSQFLVADEKEYIADVRLGVSTPTYDADFRLKAEATENQSRAEATANQLRGDANPSISCGFRLQAEDLALALDRFRGTFLQTPPPHSAKKIAGRRAYEHARQQQTVELKPVEVSVYTLELVGATPDTKVGLTSGLIRLRVVCSAGFYVRSLAHDLGEALGCGAHLEALRRTRVGRFGIDRALPVELVATRPDAAREQMISSNELLGHLARVTLSDEGVRRAAHGNTIAPEHVVSGAAIPADGGRVGLFDAAGTLLAVAERRADASLQPLTVLV
jgi:tRNA pseudouridine55 synthase